MCPQEKWSAVYNVRTILLSIQSLLGGAEQPRAGVSNSAAPRPQPSLTPLPPRSADPNLDSPLNGHAASIWHNVPEYKKALLKHKTTHGAERRAS